MKKILAVLILICLLCGSVAWADAIPVPSAPTEIPEGSVGVWKVPSLKTATPLYKKDRGQNGQDIVDAEDSALLKYYGVGYAILDHAGSETGKGIWHVEDIKVEDVAWWITEGGIEQYRCYAVVRATQTGSTYTVKGTPVYPLSSTDILCVSCAVKDGDVFIAFFKDEGEWG